MTRPFRSFALTVVFASSLLWMPPVSAQVATGTPPFGSFGGGPDIINLANLNSHIDIPVLNKPGRGTNFTYDLSFDTAVWFPLVSGSTKLWQPVSNFGWRGITEVATGYVSFNQWTGQCYTDAHTLETFYVYDTWAYHDSWGVVHDFPNVVLVNRDTWGCSGINPVNSDAANDGSGYALSNATLSGATITAANGTVFHSPSNATAGSGSFTDRNGNQITANTSGQFFDTLNSTTAVLTVAGSGNSSSPLTFTYTAPSGANASFTMKYTAYTVKTNFGCSGVSEYGPTSVGLVSEVDLPDGSKYTFTYEATPGYAGDVTGRLYQVTLPTGGTVTYTYSSGNNGISCSDGSTATLTRATPDGTWTYTQAKGSGAASTTTVTDPQGNVSTIYFEGIYETQRVVKQGSSTTMLTTNTCYNGAAMPCTGTAITLPITQRDTYTQLPGTANLEAKHTELYYVPASTGVAVGAPKEVDDYNYGSGGLGPLLKQTLISYAALSNNINVFKQQVTVKNAAGTVVSQTTYNYDEGTVTTSSGTPQHTSVSGSRGNLTSIDYPAGSLVSHTTYYDTGTPNTSTDVNGAVTTYNYPDATSTCGNAFPTSVNEPLSLSRYMTWNCTGGVQLTAKDENNQTTTTTYNDADFWRPNISTDQLGNQTSFYYQPNPTNGLPFTVAWFLTFNNGSSEASDIHYLDGLGRTYVDQRYQTPNSSSLDSVSYTFDSNGRLYSVSTPCTISWAQTCSTPKTTQTYDALNRPLQTIDGGGGSVTYTYSQNDVLVSVNAPSGENAKRRQLEYDALGRLTSVCELTNAPGYGTCGQNNQQNGYWTKYAYDALGNLTGVTQNAQSGNLQTRSFSYDAMSRLTSETNPESGVTNYVNDTDSTCGTSAGDRVKKTDADGNVTCTTYDALHRVTSITYPSGPYASVTPSKYFNYDNPCCGWNLSNTKGRFWGGHTCFSPCSSLVTDLTMSYSARGEITDIYESAPNSGGYYHVNQQYWANGATSQLTAPGIPTITYSVDGEGRPSAVGTNVVSSTSYNAASLPTNVSYYSGDSDSFVYDPQTNRMTQYQFGVNGSALTGVLGWNANGTLGAQQITDSFNSAGTQNCSYVHDDLSRIGSVNCAGSEISNPGFEGGNTNWAFSNSQCCTVVNNPANAQSGNWYLSISATTDIWASAENNGNQWLPVAPGQVINFGGWLRRVSGTGNMWYSCEVVDANHNFVSWCPAAGIGDGSSGTSWTFYQQQITIPANGAYIIFHAEIHGGNDPDTSLTTAYFDSAFFDNPSGNPVWTQAFSYDALGNITKTVPTGGTGYSFQPTYSTSTNQMTKIAGFTPTYDANGNVTNDSLHSYTWDADGHVVTVDGVSLTYDVLGRLVEKNNSGYTQFIYAPTGQKLSIMNGQTLQKALVSLPGGGLAAYNSSGLLYYGHPDHLGSIRFASTPSRSMYFDLAYAPFGETYATSGSTDISFTGQRQDTVANLYDFPAREYGIQGRWPSPDPAGLAAVDPTNPQSWNRYAYVMNNPLNSIDPSGMITLPHMGGGFGLGGLLNIYIGLGMGAMDGSCTLDGADAPCGIVQGVLQSGAGAVCPNNDCNGVTLKGDTFYANVYGQTNSLTSTLNNCVPFGEGACQGSIQDVISGGWRSVPVGALAPSDNVFWSMMDAYWQGVPWAGTIGIESGTIANAGTAIPIAYIPKTNTICLGLGPAGGVSLPGEAFTVNGGPLLLVSGNAKDVLSGLSLNWGVQPIPVLGYQHTVNKSGSGAGPTIGSIDGGFSATYSGCWDVHR